MAKSPLILPRGMKTEENPADFDTDPNAPDLHPYNPLFKVALLAIYHGCDELRSMNIEVDMGMTKEAGKKNMEVGLFTARWENWAATLNWKKRKIEKLPEDYIGIRFADVDVGIIGPYDDMRTCWNCDLTGFQDPAQKVPWVVPGDYCPRCNQLDWWGRTVYPEDFTEAACAMLADKTKRATLYDAMGGVEAEDDRAIRNTGRDPLAEQRAKSKPPQRIAAG